LPSVNRDIKKLSAWGENPKGLPLEANNRKCSKYDDFCKQQVARQLTVSTAFLREFDVSTQAKLQMQIRA